MLDSGRYSMNNGVVVCVCVCVCVCPYTPLWCAGYVCWWTLFNEQSSNGVSIYTIMGCTLLYGLLAGTMLSLGSDAIYLDRNGKPWDMFY